MKSEVLLHGRQFLVVEVEVLQRLMICQMQKQITVVALGMGTGTLAVDDGTNIAVAIGKDALNDQTSGNFNCAVGNDSFSLLTKTHSQQRSVFMQVVEPFLEVQTFFLDIVRVKV